MIGTDQYKARLFVWRDGSVVEEDAVIDLSRKIIRRENFPEPIYGEFAFLLMAGKKVHRDGVCFEMKLKCPFCGDHKCYDDITLEECPTLSKKRVYPPRHQQHASR
jgi:hypothetical protein